MWDKIRGTSGILTQRKTKMRVAPITKLKLSTPDSRSYWTNVVEDLEARVTKVRHESSVSFPSLSIAPSLRCSASDDNRVDHNLVDSSPRMENVARELIVRVSPPSPSHNECVRDINLQDPRHVEHINYLRDCDNSNFQLDFLAEEISGRDQENKETAEEKMDHTRNRCEMYSTILKKNSPPLDKLTQILKISSYVNEFLTSTRLKVGPSKVPEKNISPVTTRESIQDKCAYHPRLIRIPDPIDEEICTMGTRRFENIDRVDEQRAEHEESGELLGKHVGFQGINTNSEEEECLRLQRPRAPSLGVASAVPSFGRILSSFENSDSTESSSLKDYPIGNNKANWKDSSIQSSKDFLRVPEQKIMMVTDSKNILLIHHGRSHKTSVKSHRRGSIKSTSLSTESFTTMNISRKDKLKQWSKQSITHVIRALHRMKHRPREKTNSTYEMSVPTKNVADFHADHDRSDRNAEFPYTEEPSTNTTKSSTSPDQSACEESMKNSGQSKNRIKFITSASDNTNIRIGSAPISIAMDYKDFSIANDMVAMRKYESAKILNAVPRLRSLYHRRKSDKCLACLDISMKIRSSTQSKFSIFSRNNVPMLPSQSQNNLIDNITKFDETELSSGNDDISFSETIDRSRYHGFQTLSPHENWLRNDTCSAPAEHFQKTTHKDDTTDEIISPPFTPDCKIDQNSEKKQIASSKAFVSTLSLTSDRSKIPSDQDDSDQAFDDTGGADGGVVEQKTKFLAPCHAPLNLRPSLEPLKALSGKKTRSIQSRVASLEKTTDHSYDEESDDDEIPMTVNKLTDENKNQWPRIKSDDECSDTTNECKTYVDKFDFENLLLLSEKAFQNTSYVRLKAVSSILDDIYTQLNINPEIWDYNPSDFFRPMSPIIKLPEVVRIFQNGLKNNKNFIEILRILENEYTRRITDEKFMNVKSNSSNMKIIRITKRLLALLVDSKLYLNPQFTPSHSDFPPKQKNIINSRQLRKVLPVKSYNLIAPILGLSQWHPKHWSAIKDARKLKTSARIVTAQDRNERVRGSIKKSEFVTDFDLIVHPPSERGSGLSEASNKFRRMKRLNPYATFLIKPRRKAVIWRDLTKRDLEGYDPEATLKNRAAKVTDEICLNFCQWLRGLGGFNTTINEDVLKNMFETDFTADACKTMQVSISEMPMIPAAVAANRNCPEAGEVGIMQRELRRDLQAEKKVKRLVSFGTNLPQSLRFIPPKNDVENIWFRCGNVPDDLKSMDAVWEGITHLDSVKGFTKWLENHPDRTLPAALRNISHANKGVGDNP